MAQRERGDFPAVMDHSKRFLATRVVAKDSREVVVARMYDEALVTWLASDGPTEQEFARRTSERPREGRQ